MQLLTIVLSALIAAVPISAFTNGSLIPAYICNPTPDGMPKSFGELLKFVKKDVQTIAFDATAGDDVMVPQNSLVTTNTSPNSAYLLASFHNSPNKIAAIEQSVIVTTANGGPIIAGKANQLIVSTQPAGTPLSGVMLYANNAQGQREGYFTDRGGTNTFINFAGCGLNKQKKISGVVQQNLVSRNGTYAALFYNAPADITGNITIAGLSVAINGFGVWTYSFPIQPPTVALGGKPPLPFNFGGTGGLTTNPLAPTAKNPGGSAAAGAGKQPTSGPLSGGFPTDLGNIFSKFHGSGAVRRARIL